MRDFAGKMTRTPQIRVDSGAKTPNTARIASGVQLCNATGPRTMPERRLDLLERPIAAGHFA